MKDVIEADLQNKIENRIRVIKIMISIKNTNVMSLTQ